MRETNAPLRDQSTSDLLRRVVDAGIHVRQQLSRMGGMNETEMATLGHVAREAMGPAEVARRIGVTTAAATGIVDRLVARGHLERRPHASDRRRVDLHVTESGRAEVLGMLMPMLISLRDLEAGFTPEEHAVIQRYLSGALEAFAEIRD